MDVYIPFCGTPPLPGEVLTRWTLDPWLLAGLALALAAGLAFAPDRRRFALAWGLVAVLFVSPLCAASMALFSARVGQHILLTLVAAPLLASALPRLPVPPMAAALVFAALFWTWHAPAPYAATLAGDLAYWTMHLSLFASATVLFAAFQAAPGASVLAAAFTSAQLTAFAVLLTLAPEPWHRWHELTTVPYGLTALDDQQLAGALMWVAGGGLFLALTARFALGYLGRVDAEGPRLPDRAPAPRAEPGAGAGVRPS